MQVRFSLPMELDEQVAKFHLPALNALHNVQGPVESVTERSSSLPRLAPALGMLVFRAASADLDVKVVAVDDPFRALDYMVYQLNRTEFASLGSWTFCTGSSNREPSLPLS